MARRALRDGALRHRCRFPSWLHNRALSYERGDEWVCDRCGQVWIALMDDPIESAWKKLRAGFWRRPVKRFDSDEED